MDEPETHEHSLDMLLDIIRKAEEKKLKKVMDPERFKIENEFTHLTQGIFSASKAENGHSLLNAED
jgi:hypothetical protein